MVRDGRSTALSGKSRRWLDGFTDNHTHRDYTAIYSLSEDRHQLLSDKDYVSPLTRVSQDTVDLFFSHLSERELPQHWRNFQELMWKIEQHLGIKRAALVTFLSDRGSD